MTGHCYSVERRRPHVGELIRVCPTFGTPSDHPMIYAPEEGDWYPLAASVRRDIDRPWVVRVRLCENTEGERFLWCIDLAKTLPTDDSPLSAELVMATAAESVWCSRQESLGGLTFTTHPQGVFEEPTWGKYSVGDAIEKAFWNRVITSTDDPRLLAHRGEQ